MRLSWLSARPIRLLAILFACLIYLVLLIVDGVQFLPLPIASTTSPLLPWAQFGFSAFVALLFLVVGSLVWLYGRDRLVAHLLFYFSCTMAATFVVQTAAAADLQNVSPLSMISQVNAPLSLGLLSALLLVFPRNYLQEHGRKKWILSAYLVALLCLSVVLCCYVLVSVLVLRRLPSWLNIVAGSYALLALTGILITIVTSHVQTTSSRVRQQQRLFVGGVIFAFAPLLILTMLPQVLQLYDYVVDPQLSTITVGLFPLALGYSILRYQILVFDKYIRRTVVWIVGSISLVLLGYTVVALSTVFLASDLSLYVIGTVLTVLGPIVWWLARVTTEHIFFSEIASYRRLMDKPDLLVREVFDINRVAQVLTTAAVNAFETQEVCLFVLDEDTGCYQLYPSDKAKHDDHVVGSCYRRLLEHLIPVVKLSEKMSMSGKEQADRFEVCASLMEHLVRASRPLVLSEASRTDEDMPTGLARYLSTTSSKHVFDPLLALMCVQGKPIGLLVCGERGDGQQYGGPDFEIIQLLVDRYSSMLETARLYGRATQQQARITKELFIAYERQKEVDRLKDEFIITASHELQTPLTAVSGYIELLADYGDAFTPEKRYDVLMKTHRSCDELTLMVGNIMDASRVQADGGHLTLSPVPLARVVTHACEILEGVTGWENRAINLAIPAQVCVMADDLRLRQVLLNLVSNALKYSPVETDIDITATRDKDTVTVRIRDWGLGVPPADQPRLFKRFTRLARDMNSPARGAGLGLYICKQLIEAMGGNIWIESTGRVGEGSTFVFTLKCTPEH